MGGKSGKKSKKTSSTNSSNEKSNSCISGTQILKISEFEIEDEENGHNLSGVIIPEEMIIEILSHLKPNDILQFGLVCKKWYNLTRSHLYWSTLCKLHNIKWNKDLPWYVYYCLFATHYFNTNLIKNGNGEQGFQHWKIIRNGGDQFRIEKNPEQEGAYELPINVPDFNGHTSCFATSYGTCGKQQTIEINNKLFCFILDTYKPHIYASEWVTGRFDCASLYKMCVTLFAYDGSDFFDHKNEYECKQWSDPHWTKISINITDYPKGVRQIIFVHIGKDKQFWAGHFGTKMAGAVLKFEFDSLAIPCKKKLL